LTLEIDAAFAASATALFTAQHAAWLESIARLHALIDPLTVSATLRSDGTIVQTVLDGGSTVTLTTTASPAGSPGWNSTMADLLGKLARVHALRDPLVVTATTRGDGTLAQTMSTVSGTTTVTTL
jgi:hypothetical protein